MVCSIHKRCYLLQKFLSPKIKNKDVNSWNVYRKCQNHVTSLIRKKKSDYLHNVIQESSIDSCQMYKLLNDILPNRSRTTFYYDITPDEFNNYFSRMESNFKNDICIPQFYVPEKLSFKFGLISSSFIVRELLTLKHKSSPDVLGLHGTYLSLIAHATAPSLYVLFNKSLRLGYVPSDWKLAHVTPLYKGNGSKKDLNNYQPISVISHMPKIIEICWQFTL